LQREYPDVTHIAAEVLADNHPSHRLFTGAGYVRTSTRYQKEVGP
jgi:RimJ/RimL family protein N-acetyltransferase